MIHSFTFTFVISVVFPEPERSGGSTATRP